MLKTQSDKQFLLSNFSEVFEKCFFKPFRVYDYGICFIEDMLSDIPENTILMEDVEVGSTRDLRIAIFKRDQTNSSFCIIQINN